MNLVPYNLVKILTVYSKILKVATLLAQLLCNGIAFAMVFIARIVQGAITPAVRFFPGTGARLFVGNDHADVYRNISDLSLCNDEGTIQSFI